ncbi:Microsomal glutathione S-transferase 3 [Phlyctochytrium planicorne]|nr:Microsomal glutathione S-transferase 3 [Phlyctochytrium planicorne]
MTTITIAPEYGYVLATGAAYAVFLTFLGVKVGGARGKAQVKYPNMYASAKEAEEDRNKHIFNCAASSTTTNPRKMKFNQRAHHNTLEQSPGFLVLLFAGGIEHPVIAAASGLLFIVGRYSYASGYWTGEPKNRNRGAFAYLGLLSLLGLTIKASVNLVLSK